MTRCSTRCCLLTSVGTILLWLFIAFEIPKETGDGRDVMIAEGQEATYDSKKNLGPLEDWQTVAFKYSEKIQKRKKTWMTIGISSVSQQDPYSLLYTLASLYQASSAAERKRLTVLVHLADSDLTWLKDTTAHISRLFSPQILAGQLLLIHVPPEAYPTVSGIQDKAYKAEIYSKQNVNHAFLMSFATKLSDYFLLIGDNVFCAPNFVTQIYSEVTTMKHTQWVLLEFSNMGFIGKLFHSKDLPLLAHFLLLFHKDKPLDRLIRHFRTLLVQEKPILYRPFLFYHRLSHPNFDGNMDTEVQQRNISGPSNPPGSVFTDMSVSDVHFPWEAYTLDESFFWTNNVSAGNHLTVLLNHPAMLSKVQVMTGSILDGKYALKKGQVELGYDPEGMPQYCTRFALLGHLVEGQLDQEIFQESLAYPVSCVRLVVNANQVAGLIIRHIYLWEKSVEKAQS